MSEWMPISEFNPEIHRGAYLVFVPYQTGIAQYESAVEDGCEDIGHDAGWFGTAEDGDLICYGRTHCDDSHFIEPRNQPTHFMPLPQPPKEAE